MNVLSSDQIEQFIQNGFLILHDCYSREAAVPLVEEAWRLLGYDPHDRTTWEKPIAFLFPETHTPLREFSPKLWSAIRQLCGGEERLAHSDYEIGQWVINFHNGDNEPYVAPGRETKGWHVDGVFFRHFLDSPEQGLLVVPLFSDVKPRGGGTVFAADSVPAVARFLAERPDGVLPKEFRYRDIVVECEDFHEITGNVGDVVIFHPFMMHSFAQNQRPEPRFITNLCVSLREPMNFNRPPEQQSAVERAITRGLGVERLDFAIQHERERWEV